MILELANEFVRGSRFEITRTFPPPNCGSEFHLRNRQYREAMIMLVASELEELAGPRFAYI
jgi:hypothetical protein